MRTVVYISGQPREVAYCWKSWWYNCISNFPNPEVFIYTDQKYPVDKEFFDVVKPRKYLVEPQVMHPEHKAALDKINYISENHKNSLAQQQYGKKMVWELADRWQKESGAKYDYAIRLRPDLIIMQKISPEIIDFNCINTLNRKSDIVTCEFCISNFNIIKDYMHIYDWTVRFAPKICVNGHPRLPAGSPWHSDFMMGVYMEDVCKHKMADGPHITTSSNYYRILRIFHQYGNVQFDTKM
jgi:hypothetical protein